MKTALEKRVNSKRQGWNLARARIAGVKDLVKQQMLMERLYDQWVRMTFEHDKFSRFYEGAMDFVQRYEETGTLPDSI